MTDITNVAFSNDDLDDQFVIWFNAHRGVMQRDDDPTQFDVYDRTDVGLEGEADAGQFLGQIEDQLDGTFAVRNAGTNTWALLVGDFQNMDTVITKVLDGGVFLV